VSQLHTRVFRRDGQFMVEDLGSTNGTYLNRQKVSGPMVMQRGDKLKVGNTVLELA
jgi:pSer/pThr/pTyr-binding forkhead associated (FHA) protein